MTLMAASTSTSITCSRRCIAACASDMRMMLSMWRTATGMPSRVCGADASGAGGSSIARWRGTHR